MIKPRKYAVLANYASSNPAVGIVTTLLTFDSLQYAREIAMKVMKGKAGVFAVLEKDECVQDEYDDVTEYLYNPVAVWYSWGGKETHLSTVEGVEVIQTFRQLPDSEEIPEGTPIILDKDGRERDDLFTLFANAKIVNVY